MLVPGFGCERNFSSHASPRHPAPTVENSSTTTSVKVA